MNVSNLILATPRRLKNISKHGPRSFFYARTSTRKTHWAFRESPLSCSHRVWLSWWRHVRTSLGRITHVPPRPTLRSFSMISNLNFGQSMKNLILRPGIQRFLQLFWPWIWSSLKSFKEDWAFSTKSTSSYDSINLRQRMTCSSLVKRLTTGNSTMLSKLSLVHFQFWAQNKSV